MNKSNLSISFCLQQQTALSHDQLAMILGGCLLDFVANAFHIWVCDKGISTVEGYLKRRCSCLLLDYIVLDLNSCSECDGKIVQLQPILLCSVGLANAWELNLLRVSTCLAAVMVRLLEEIKHVTLILSFIVLGTTICARLSSFIYSFFDA